MRDVGVHLNRSSALHGRLPGLHGDGQLARACRHLRRGRPHGRELQRRGNLEREEDNEETHSHRIVRIRSVSELPIYVTDADRYKFRN